MKSKKKLYEEIARLFQAGVDINDADAVVAACTKGPRGGGAPGYSRPIQAWIDDGCPELNVINVEWTAGDVCFADSDEFLRLLGIEISDAAVSADPALRALAAEKGAAESDVKRLLEAWREGSGIS